jgi:hypothetical protein
MQADLSKPFRHPRKHYRRVLMQQGRVQLDSDWNEQVDILLHYLQALAADLTGPHGTPMLADGSPGTGFDIEEDEELRRDFLILPGHYYVDGILCENDRTRRYRHQPDYPELPESAELEDDGEYVVYLDVWERHITYVEDPRIREIALGGPDTTTRSRVVCQVKVLPIEDDDLDEEGEELNAPPEEWVRKRLLASTGVYALSTARLCARVRPDRPSTDPCIVSPTSRYRGLENQLYRVEIHEGWRARDREEREGEEEREEEREDARRAERREERSEGRREEREEGERRQEGEEGEWHEEHEEEEREWAEAEEEEEEEEERREREGTARRGPTFKWSRENASVIFPIRSIEGNTVTLDNLGRDERLGLQTGDWVEIIDDVYDLHRSADPLLRVTAPPDPVRMKVTLDHAPTAGRKARHPFLRRWDQRSEHGATLRSGAVPIVEDRWIDLEDGIQVRFVPGRSYRTGDYWLIPARTATGEIEWPRDEGRPECLRPQGIVHHYAPLGRIEVDDGEIEVIDDYRRALLRPWAHIEEEEDEEEEEARHERKEEEEEKEKKEREKDEHEREDEGEEGEKKEEKAEGEVGTVEEKEERPRRHRKRRAEEPETEEKEER